MASQRLRYPLPKQFAIGLAAICALASNVACQPTPVRELAYQVDLDAVGLLALQAYEYKLQALLLKSGTRSTISAEDGYLDITFRLPGDLDQARRIIRDEYPELNLTDRTIDDGYRLRIGLTAQYLNQAKQLAIQKDIEVIRDRIENLGILGFFAKPIVEANGPDRISVKLPEVQDPARVRDVIARSARLEYRLVDSANDALDAAQRGRAPADSELYYDRSGSPVLLRRAVIASSEQITDVAVGSSYGQPVVMIRLDEEGASRMLETTRANVGSRMAALYTEYTSENVERNGVQTIETSASAMVVSNAVISGVFGSEFQTAGFSTAEAQDLALLLRSSSLAAPIFLVEDRPLDANL